MTVYGAMAGGRKAAQLLMTDTCSVQRPGTSSGTLDMTTGMPSTAPLTAVWSGPFRVHAKKVENAKSSSTAGAFPVSENLTASFPWNAPQIQYQDVITLTGSQFHPANIGLRFRVTSIDPISQSTAQRCQVEAITG